MVGFYPWGDEGPPDVAGLPPLYARIPRGGITALLGPEPAPRVLCDGEWLIFKQAIACVARYGPGASFLSSGSRFTWVAAKAFPGDAGDRDYGPIPREIRGRDCRLPIYLFVETRGAQPVFLGRLRPAYSYGKDAQHKHGMSHHDIYPTVPARIWRELGDYPCSIDEVTAVEQLPEIVDGARTPEKRFDVLRALVEGWHGALRPGDGIPERELARYSLPAPLRWWYALAGNTAGLIDGCDVLRKPEQIALERDLSVFFDENQGVCRWAWRNGHTADPEIWCNVDDRGWQREDATLSEFLVQMFWSQAALHAPYGVSAALASRECYEAVTRPLRRPSCGRWRCWPPGGSEFYASHGVLVVASPNDDAYSICAGARTEKPLQYLREVADARWEYVAF